MMEVEELRERIDILESALRDKSRRIKELNKEIYNLKVELEAKSFPFEHESQVTHAYGKDGHDFKPGDWARVGDAVRFKVVSVSDDKLWNEYGVSCLACEATYDGTDA